jgi:predicted nucleic acid-binding protein
MIVLDTNVVSEPLRAAPSPSVLAWLDRQPPSSLFLTAITVREMIFGVRSMPDGKRRDGLEQRIIELFEGEFAGRILPFDTTAAMIYGRAVPLARASGRTISEADGMIAAVVLASGAAIATRDTSPFVAMTIAQVIEPWRAGF